MINPTRLSKIANRPLFSGSHTPSGNEMCVMEAVAYVAGEPWSDRPMCACPVIAAFLRRWNDCLPDDDRTLLLAPLIPRVIGTKSTSARNRHPLRSNAAPSWR